MFTPEDRAFVPVFDPISANILLKESLNQASIHQVPKPRSSEFPGAEANLPHHGHRLLTAVGGESYLLMAPV